MSATPPQPPPKSFALKFVSGKYQGGVFPLRPDRDVVVGRGSDLDLVLAEDMVSRKHAKIFFREGAFWIQDLGSTNGTFVNGEKVKRARLSEGDRLLIGSSILKVVSDAATGEQTDEEIRRGLEQAASTSPRVSGMQGRLEEVPLPDLLQLLGTAKKTGLLLVRDAEHEARLQLRAGRVVRCVLDGNLEIAPRKSFFRLLQWTAGTFEFGPAPEAEDPAAPEITDALDALLVQGMRELDELRRVQPDLPARQAQLVLVAPLTVPLRALSPEELDVLQLALNHPSVQAVLDRASTSDADAALALTSLVKRGYLRVGA